MKPLSRKNSTLSGPGSTRLALILICICFDLAAEPLNSHEMRVCSGILFGLSNKLATEAKKGDPKALKEMHESSAAAVLYIHMTEHSSDKERDLARGVARRIEKNDLEHIKKANACLNSLNESIEKFDISEEKKEDSFRLARDIVSKTIIIKTN